MSPVCLHPPHMSILQPLQSSSSAVPSLARGQIWTACFSFFFFFCLLFVVWTTFAIVLMDDTATQCLCELNGNRGRGFLPPTPPSPPHPPHHAHNTPSTHPPRALKFTDRWKRTHAQKMHKCPRCNPLRRETLNQFDCGGGLWRRERERERRKEGD